MKRKVFRIVCWVGQVCMVVLIFLEAGPWTATLAALVFVMDLLNTTSIAEINRRLDRNQ